MIKKSKKHYAHINSISNFIIALLVTKRTYTTPIKDSTLTII